MSPLSRTEERILETIFIVGAAGLMLVGIGLCALTIYLLYNVGTAVAAAL